LEDLLHEVESLGADLQVAHVWINEAEEDSWQVIIEINDVKHVAREEVHALTEKVRGLALRLAHQETENNILNVCLTSRDEDVEELTMQVKQLEAHGLLLVHTGRGWMNDGSCPEVWLRESNGGKHQVVCMSLFT
jgi:hypothetical protein